MGKDTTYEVEPRFDLKNPYVFDPHEEREEEIARADEVFYRVVKPKLEDTLRKPNLKKKYKTLKENADKMGINVENPFEDIEAKSLELRDIMDWRRFVSHASDYAIGNAYKKAYKSGTE